MNKFKTAGCLLALGVLSKTAAAVPFSFEARSLGMGNVGVATADIATAPFANPAMLAYQREDDDFSLLLAIGGFLNDSGGLIDDIDAFQSAQSANDIATMQTIVSQLGNKVIAPEVTGAFAVGFAGEKYSMAVSGRKDLIAVGFMSDIDATAAGVVDPASNILNISGVESTEIGLSFARNFDFGGKKVSVGLTPKIVSLEAISASESISSADTDLGDLLDDSIRDLDDFTTLDAGVVVEMSDSVQFGVVAKNLITEDVVFLAADGITPVNIKFDTQLRAGMAYRSSLFTLGADLDLIENESISSTGAKTQMLSLGAEFNAFDFAQLRVGAIKNIASGISSEDKKTLLTAGVGFWLGFNLDLAVVSGEGDSAGVFLQTGFRF